MFQRLFPRASEWRIIDLGGMPETWFRAPIKPKHVTVVNTSPLETPSESWLHVEQGDACALSDRILSQPFDLVFSNSLIEHVGGDARCRALADSVHSLAPRHWVQTPYRYFPVEPHWLFPGLQFLPVRARATIVRSWPLANRAASEERALSLVLGTVLLSRTEMRHYFPHSEILTERVGPFVKSLIACRTVDEACSDAAAP